MMKLRLIAAALLCVFVAGLQAKEPLRIGEKAPEFKVGRWLNQGPITAFRPGHIYVLEFWATWCGPCKAAMPHLSELAKKYEGKVTVIGVNVFERTPDQAKLDDQLNRFMKGGGKAMQYPVCTDTPELHLTKKWYERTGSVGIPATVVVDGKGNIAAFPGIGGLETTIQQLIAGTYDYKAAAAAREARQRQAAAEGDGGMEALKAIAAAAQAREWNKVITLADEARINNSRYGVVLDNLRYQATLHTNEDEAFRLAQEAARQHRALSSYVSAIAKEDGLSKRMYELALSVLQRKELSNQDKLDMASTYFRMGEPAKAVPYQREVYEWGKATELTPTYLDAVEEDLKKYEAAATAAGNEASEGLEGR